MGLTSILTWFKENWIYGAVAWFMFILSLGVTLVCFMPVIAILSLFGVDLNKWSEPFDLIWQAMTLQPENGRWVLFSLVFFPFVFRNFLKFMKGSTGLEPSDWGDDV